MRLNWFIPRKSALSAPARLVERFAPSWRSSPFRRIVQTAAFAAFLATLFYVLQPAPPADGQSTDLSAAEASRQFVRTQIFLALDPLVSITAAIASRTWIASMAAAGVLLALSVLVPRLFCGYICPLGTMIDIFDWLIGARLKRFHVRRRGWFVHLKYYVLAGVILIAIFGVTIGAVLAAIPLVTRGLAMSVGFLQAGAAAGSQDFPPLDWTNVLAAGLLMLVLMLGVLGRRFWCRYVCPTGAVFSLASLLRLTDRTVTDKCIECGKCARSCAFGAITSDFTARGLDCTFCQTCGGDCPTQAIEFRPRWQKNAARRRSQESPEVSLSRRGFLASGLGAAAVAFGLPRIASAGRSDGIIRPPGSRPEDIFSRMCIRCGQCVKACPTNRLQPLGVRAGLENLWTPYANADWGKCDPTCNLCGKVCPTGAIEYLSVEQKKSRKMGLAQIDRKTCLAYNNETCAVCALACLDAGYAAIDIDYSSAVIVEDSQIAPGAPDPSVPPRPVIDPTRCVGCGACQHACRTNVVLTGKLRQPAIVVQSLGK